LSRKDKRLKLKRICNAYLTKSLLSDLSGRGLFVK